MLLSRSLGTSNRKLYCLAIFIATLLVFFRTTGLAAEAVELGRDQINLASDTVSSLVRQGGDDFDADGFVNSNDNCVQTPNPDQIDFDSDGIGNTCDADLNNDCVVNFLDLVELTNVFLGSDPNADLTGDGVVNFFDLLILRDSFLSEPGPSGVANICGSGPKNIVTRHDLLTSAPDITVAGNVLVNDEYIGAGFFDPQAVLVAPPRRGELVGVNQQVYGGLAPFGAFEYQPAVGYTGVDSFAYRIINAGVSSKIATVYIVIGDLELAPLANWRVVVHAPSEENRTPFELLSSAPNEPSLRLEPTSQSDRWYLRYGNSAMETWLPDAAGSIASVFNFNALPWQEFDIEVQATGELSITSVHTGRELAVSSNQAGGSVITQAAADNPMQRWLFGVPGQGFAPTAQDDQYVVQADTVLSENAISNDIANGFDILSVAVTAPNHGQLVGVGQIYEGGMAPWGSFDYQPDPGFTGRDEFVYYVRTSSNGTPSHYVTVTLDVVDQQ